jgi:hypothetical protein
MSDNGSANVIGSSNRLTNTWYFISGTFNISSKALSSYINNLLIYTKSLSNVTYNSTNTDLKLGNLLDGYLDNARIYNRTLSVDEISEIYNRTKSKYQ